MCHSSFRNNQRGRVRLRMMMMMLLLMATTLLIPWGYVCFCKSGSTGGMLDVCSDLQSRRFQWLFAPLLRVTLCATHLRMKGTSSAENTVGTVSGGVHNVKTLLLTLTNFHYIRNKFTNMISFKGDEVEETILNRV